MPELVTTRIPLRAVKAGDDIILRDTEGAPSADSAWAQVKSLKTAQVWATLVTEKGNPEGSKYRMDRMVWVRRMQKTADERAAERLEITQKLIQDWIQRASIDLEETGANISEALRKGLALQPSQVERRYKAERTYAYSRDFSYDLTRDGEKEQELSEQEFTTKVLRRWQNRLTQEAIRELRHNTGSICYAAQQEGFNDALRDMLTRIERWLSGLTY